MKPGKIISLLVCALAFAAQCGFAAGHSDSGPQRKLPELGMSAPTFKDGIIPDQYSSCKKGSNTIPPLIISKIPAAAKALALIVDDPDAPAKVWVHWLVFNIPVSSPTLHIDGVPAGARQGRNDYGNNRYDGPCPPSGTHTYVFRAYALDAPLTLQNGATRQELNAALKVHAIAQEKLSAKYTRKSLFW